MRILIGVGFFYLMLISGSMLDLVVDLDETSEMFSEPGFNLLRLLEALPAGSMTSMACFFLLLFTVVRASLSLNGVSLSSLFTESFSLYCTLPPNISIKRM